MHFPILASMEEFEAPSYEVSGEVPNTAINLNERHNHHDKQCGRLLAFRHPIEGVVVPIHLEVIASL